MSSPFFDEPDPHWLAGWPPGDLCTAYRTPRDSVGDVTKYLALLAPDIRIKEATAENMMRILPVTAGTAAEVEGISPDDDVSRSEGLLCSSGETVVVRHSVMARDRCRDSEGSRGGEISEVPRGTMSEGQPIDEGPARETGETGDDVDESDAGKSEDRSSTAGWTSPEVNYLSCESDGERERERRRARTEPSPEQLISDSRKNLIPPPAFLRNPTPSTPT